MLRGFSFFQYVGDLIDELERAGNYRKISEGIWRNYSGTGCPHLPRGISNQLYEKFQETLDDYIKRGLIRTDAGSAAGPDGILLNGYNLRELTTKPRSWTIERRDE